MHIPNSIGIQALTNTDRCAPCLHWPGRCNGIEGEIKKEDSMLQLGFLSCSSSWFFLRVCPLNHKKNTLSLCVKRTKKKEIQW